MSDSDIRPSPCPSLWSDPIWIKERAEEVRETSSTVIRGLFPVEAMDKWNERFQPLLRDAIKVEKDNPNRGPNRYYVTLPFDSFWADPNIIDNPVIMAIVGQLVGEDGVMCQLATDTPCMGSTYQDLHRDTQLLFPETNVETAPYQLAVNFPLIDVTPKSNNGPMEQALRTHMCTKAEGMSRIEQGEIKVEPSYMWRGDVMIRDVRHIHRGTPNRTEVPRPMVVIGYSRRWLFRPEVDIRVPKEVLSSLPKRCQQWLRFNPLFDSIEEANSSRQKESYRAFAY